MRATRPASFLAFALAAAVAPVALGGCQYFTVARQTRGNLVDPIDYSQLVPGTSTRADAQSLLGSPTTRATFDDNTWIYVGELTQPTVGGYPHIDKQLVLVLNFDGNGVLRSMTRETKKDAIRVAMDSRVTPSPGSQATFLQQVIGNVGRYNPAGLLGATGTNPNGSAGGEGGAGNTLP